MIRKTFIASLAVIGLVAFAMGVLSIWLQTEAGIAFATRHAEAVLSRASGYDVGIERLRFTLPLKANIRTITVNEGEKRVASASSVRIDVAALPLLFKSLEISRLKASVVTLDLPQVRGERERWSWPELAWKYSAHRIAIDRLEIKGSTFSTRGKVAVGGDLLADLSLEFYDPPLGRYQIDLNGKRRADAIHLKIVKEETGSLLNAGGVAIESFTVTAFGKFDSFEAVLSDRGGTPEQQLIGDFQLDVTTNAKTDPIAASLIGKEAQVEGVYTIDGRRTLRVNPIQGAGIGFTLDGKLVANLDGTIEQGELQVTLSDLSLLNGLLGFTYSGDLKGTVALSGTFTSPAATLQLAGDQVEIEGRSFKAMSSRFTWTGNTGNLTAQATIAELPLELTTSVQKGALRDIRLTGPEAEITGSLAFNAEGITSFELEGEIARLWAWAPLLQLDVEGQLEFAADYTNDTFSAAIQTSALNFQYLALEEARIETTLTSPFSSPQGELRAMAEEASYRRIAAQEVNFTSAIGGEAWPFTLSWEGEEEVSGSASGAWRATRETFWSRWETFGGEILDVEVALLQPITTEKKQSGPIVFTPLHLRAGDGSLYLSYDPDTLILEMERFPLQAAELILPGLGLVGSADSNITLKGLRKGGKGTLALSVTGVELKESPITDLGSLWGSFNGRLKNGRLDASLTADSTRGSPLKLTISLPLKLGSQPLSVEIPAEGSVTNAGVADASVSGDGRFVGELAPLIQFFLPYNLQLSGNVDAKVTLSGTVEMPDLRGQLLFKNGLLEEASSGARLSQIDALFEADGPRITLESMSAKAGEGFVTATGFLDVEPSEHYPFSIDGKLENAQLVALSVASASATGDLILSGPFLSPTFSGTLVTDSARITLPKRFSQTGYPNLEVTYINLPPSKREIAKRTQPVNIGLDIKLIVPDNLKVRGRGARATLGGEVEIEGTIERPIMEGELTLTKGEFTFGSKNFNLTAGTIAFDGPVEDRTRIDVSGSIRVADVEVGATISGILPSVQLTLFSNPPMTDREILSYLLFDSPASLIGAGQALQLAAASGEVAAGNFGPGLLASLPKTIGLDGLTVTSPAGNSEELGIQATKRLSPNFDINIYKSVNSASNHLIIEFNFFRAFSFRAERVEETDDEPGADRFSLRWTHDY